MAIQFEGVLVAFGLSSVFNSDNLELFGFLLPRDDADVLLKPNFESIPDIEFGFALLTTSCDLVYLSVG
jgi:hypothetical protein